MGPNQQPQVCTTGRCQLQPQYAGEYSAWPPSGSTVVQPTYQSIPSQYSSRSSSYSYGSAVPVGQLSCPPPPGQIVGGQYHSSSGLPPGATLAKMKPAELSQIKKSLGVESDPASLADLKAELGSSFRIEKVDGKVTISYRPPAGMESLELGYVSQKEYSRNAFNPDGLNMKMSLPGFADRTSQEMAGSYKAEISRVEIGDGLKALQHTIMLTDDNITHIRLQVGEQNILVDVQALLKESSSAPIEKLPPLPEGGSMGDPAIPDTAPDTLVPKSPAKDGFKIPDTAPDTTVPGAEKKDEMSPMGDERTPL